MLASSASILSIIFKFSLLWASWLHRSAVPTSHTPTDFSIFRGMEQLLEPGTAQTLLVLLTRGDIYSPPCTPHKQSLFSCWVLGGRNCQVEKEGHLEKMLIAAWEERKGPCVCEWLYTCNLLPKMASVKSRVTAVCESSESRNQKIYVNRVDNKNSHIMNMRAGGNDRHRLPPCKQSLLCCRGTTSSRLTWSSGSVL